MLSQTVPVQEQVDTQGTCLFSWNVCGPTSSLKAMPKSLGELADFDLIGVEHSLLRIPVLQEFETRYASQVVARTNDFSTMAAMVRAGIGLALLPSDQQETGITRLFTYPGHRGELWLLAHPDLRHQARVKAVWDTLFETLS